MLKIKIMNNLKRCQGCRKEYPLDMYIGVTSLKCECCIDCRKHWWKSPEKNLKKIQEKKENGGKTVQKEKVKVKPFICDCGYKIRNRKQDMEEHKKTYKHKRGKEEIQKTHHTCECGSVIKNHKGKIENHKRTNKHKRLMESLSN